MLKFALRFFVVLNAFCVFASENARGEEVTLVADPWCPYNCQLDSPSPGILIEIAQQAFSKSGHTVIYKTMPWKRAIASVRNGKFDGIVGTGPEETPDFVFTDKEILTVDHTFFIRKSDNWFYQGLSSLADRKLGVIRGYSYGDFNLKFIQPHAADGQKVLIITGETPLRRLLNLIEIGRVDTLIEDRTAFNYNLRGMPGLDRVKPAGFYTKEKIFIAFSPAKKSSDALAGILSRFIVENGSVIENVTAKYLR